MTTNNQPFGVTPDGQSAGLWTISNSKGLTLSLTNWGAAIVSLSQADRNGCFANVALGFSDASKYVAAAGYLGRDMWAIRESHRERSIHSRR